MSPSREAWMIVRDAIESPARDILGCLAEGNQEAALNLLAARPSLRHLVIAYGLSLMGWGSVSGQELHGRIQAMLDTAWERGLI